MEPLSLDEFTSAVADFDACVGATAEIDHFCSSSDWILPAMRALMPRRKPWLWRSENGGGFAALMRARHPRGFTYAEPLEAMWGLACPLVGAEPAKIVPEFAATAREHADDWDVLVLSGIPPDGEIFSLLCDDFGRDFRIAIGPVAARQVADLGGGADAFLERRGRNLRKTLRRAERRARDEGITFHVGEGDPDELYRRIQAIEDRSWKGGAGVGINSGSMRDFYRLMLGRLARRGGHRVLFAAHGDRDIAYVLGGMWNGGYRGLQFSYDAAYRELSLGNLCQLEQVRRLCAEGARSYDLGTTGLDYKQRWAERTIETVAVLILRALL